MPASAVGPLPALAAAATALATAAGAAGCTTSPPSSRAPASPSLMAPAVPALPLCMIFLGGSAQATYRVASKTRRNSKATHGLSGQTRNLASISATLHAPHSETLIDVSVGRTAAHTRRVGASRVYAHRCRRTMIGARSVTHMSRVPSSSVANFADALGAQRSAIGARDHDAGIVRSVERAVPSLGRGGGELARIAMGVTPLKRLKWRLKWL